METFNLKKTIYLLLSIILLIAIGILDHITGTRVSLLVFYALPIVIATVKVNKITGITVSLLCAIVWSITHFTSGNYVVTYWNTIMRMFFFFLVVIFIELKWSYEWLREEHGKDFLTTIYSRKHFFELANKELERFRRYGRPLSLAFFGCNKFKEINDQLGHQKGDFVLKLIAQTIKKYTFK